ncbi:MAG: rod shape-determining protein MreC [bacterium]
MGGNQYNYNYPFRSKFKYVYLLIFFLCISLAIMTYKSHNLNEELFVVKIIIEAVSPIHRAMVWFYNGIGSIWSNYIYLVKTQKNNKLLKDKIEELKALETKYIETKLANDRLTKLLEFKQHLSYPIIAAQIIGKDSTSWSRTILLNKGSRVGIKINQPVVMHQGLVGKVTRVTPSTSLVQLITDKNSHVAAIIQNSRVEGILVGKSQNTCILKYIERGADIQVGNRVLTSGMGGIFPKGLMLGVIDRIDKKPYELFQYAEISANVPFSRLEEVLVLLKDNEE